MLKIMKQTYADSLADAETSLLAQAGRGVISHLILGREHAAVVSTLPGFVKLSDGASLGAHIFGTYNNVPVIRVPEDALLGAKQGIGIWKGATNFEAPAVYAPYMPLSVTGLLPLAPNPLGNMRAAAVMAAVEVLVSNYAVNFDITA